MQALTFADHGEVVGLQAHRQIAEAEQADQQHGGCCQWLPVRFDPAPGAGRARRRQGRGGAVYRRATPGRLGFFEGIGVGRVAGQPAFKLGLLPGLRALQGDQPVEGLVHSRVLQHLMSQLMGAQFVRVCHGVPRVFATFYSFPTAWVDISVGCSLRPIQPFGHTYANGHDQFQFFLHGAQGHVQLIGNLLVAATVQAAEDEDLLLARA